MPQIEAASYSTALSIILLDILLPNSHSENRSFSFLMKAGGGSSAPQAAHEVVFPQDLDAA